MKIALLIWGSFDLKFKESVVRDSYRSSLAASRLITFANRRVDPPLYAVRVSVITFLPLNEKLRRMSFPPWFLIPHASLQARLVHNGFSSTLIGGWPSPLDSLHFSLSMLYKIFSKWKIYGISGDHLESGFTKLTAGSAWLGVQSPGEEQWPRASKLMFWFTMWLGTQNFSD